MAERVLVTGAAGFVGSHLVRRLVRDGRDVVALVRPASSLWRLHDVLSSVELVRADLPRRPALGAVDAVCHLAAAGVRPDEDAHEVVETNVLGTHAALELAREGGAERFLYCGSCFEYGPGERHREDAVPRPSSEYGAAKAAGWLLAQGFCRAHGLSLVSVRPFTVYGPYEAAYRLVPSVSLGILREEPVELTAGDQTRDFVHVDDVVDASVAALEAGTCGTYNLCTGVSTPVRDVARLLAALATSRVELRLGAREQRTIEFPTLSGDPGHAAEELGWTAAISLEEGLRSTLDWFRDHRQDKAYERERARA